MPICSRPLPPIRGPIPAEVAVKAVTDEKLDPDEQAGLLGGMSQRYQSTKTVSTRSSSISVILPAPPGWPRKPTTMCPTART